MTVEALTRPDALLDGLLAEETLTHTERDGRRMAWHQWGQGQPLLFLHGGAGSWMHWIRQIAAFRDRYRILAPDLPGFGVSGAAPDPTNFPEMGRDVAAGIDTVLGENADYTILAFSMGGNFTSQLLQFQPGRQRGIFMVSPASIMKPSPPPMEKVRGKTGADLVAAHRSNLGGVMIADPARVDDLAMRIQHENTENTRLRDVFSNRGRLLPEVLPEYAGPLISLWGEADTFMGPGTLDQRKAIVKQACPQAETLSLPGVGHWANYEAADEVNALIDSFLDRLPRGA